jgi:hypothetical protein
MTTADLRRQQYVIRFDPGCGPPINEPPAWCVWKPGDFYRPGFMLKVYKYATSWQEAMRIVELELDL